MVQKRIYDYFARNARLHVLFIFDRMNIIETELETAHWPDNYVYKVFDGAWFNAKYAIENTWKDKYVVLLFANETYPQTEAQQLKFPLMDMLKANMEYKEEDYLAFMQQHNLPDKYAVFVKRNIAELTTSRITAILGEYMHADTFNEDVACRALITAYLGDKKLADWETIFVKMITLGLESEEKKRADFFWRMERNRDVQKAVVNKLTSVFGCSYNEASALKVKEVAESLKYNTITQLLDAHKADNYKAYKVTRAIALEQMNRVYERGMMDRALSEKFGRAMETLGVDIREEEIISVYGIDAPYYLMTERLCQPILKEIIETKLIEEPEKANERMRELSIKLPVQADMQTVLGFVEQVGLYYEKVRALGTLKLNSPEAYVQKYLNEFYVVDMCYRKALEAYHELVVKAPPMEQTLHAAKQQLDREYAKTANVFNLEWMTCVAEQANPWEEIGLKRQEDFYKNESNAAHKQVIIVSDALRYEVAAELMEELAKKKHVATLTAYKAMLPTETKYCKPALLPHRTLALRATEMTVDDNLPATTAERSAHVANYRNGAACITYDEVVNRDSATNVDFFKRPLVYILHDTIDNASHTQSPFKVIAACRQAIEELSKLIERLHTSWNVNNVILTADHGFIYNDMRFEEKDKHAVVEDCIEKKTRYYLTHSNKEVEGVVKFPIETVSGMTAPLPKVYVAVPQGTNRLAAPGGYNFAHGGATLQEMIIPVIHSRLKKVDKAEKVNVSLMNHNLSMVSSRLKLQVIQAEAVTMGMKERKIVCCVYNGDEAVTDSKTVTLNSTDAVNLNNRVFDISLTLNKPTTATMLQLRIFDANDRLNPIIRETVKNNTIIEQDF